MKIAIAGFGVEGRVSYDYWNTPENELTIVDAHQPAEDILPLGANLIVGEDAFSQLSGYDLVIRTAGLPPRDIKTNGKIWSATNEFFAQCPAPIIGITGSKGKGTTASFIASILKAAGKTVWLVGNIGIPGLGILSQIKPDDIVVYELSSFQLWDVEKSPSTAVLLFIEQEHLDVHLDMNEYVSAKGNITHFQTQNDLLVYNGQNTYSKQIASASAARKIAYPEKESAHIKDNSFYYGEQLICSTDVIRLVGKHNLSNACAAIDAVWQYTSDADVISKGLGDFEGLPHRLKFVREVGEIRFYDDSIATTPTSAIAAIDAFSDEPKIIILGGSSKGSDFTELSLKVRETNTYAILIGDEAAHLALTLHDKDYHEFKVIEEPTMDEVVRYAYHIAKPGAVVLLSPAAASFGLFKNYVDRGEQFIAAVNAL